jgi:hypothetical protein
MQLLKTFSCDEKSEIFLATIYLIIFCVLLVFDGITDSLSTLWGLIALANSVEFRHAKDVKTLELRV